MDRYPCENQESCPLYNSPTGCFEDVHHRQWPRRLYRSLGKTAFAFRELDQNKELTCRRRHNEIHATQAPPPVPDRRLMAEIVRAALKKA